MKIFQTERLNVRLIENDDLNLIFRLQGDAETMRYLRKPETDIEAVRERMRMWAQYHAENPLFGVYIPELKENGAPIGYCVARHVDFTPSEEHEIGYVLAPEFWGRGYASELAAGLTQYIKTIPEVSRVLAFTDPENLASQRVLLKCGFEIIGRRRVYGSDCVEFLHL